MDLLRLGADALLVECDDLAETMALHAEARRRGVEARDVVPAARTVLFDGVLDRERLMRDLPTWDLPRSERPAGDPVEIATVYDGTDLADVARLWRTTPEEVVATHTAASFVVAFCGFAPGFAYCTGLPPHLAVPRRVTPRPAVPAGSVALAGEFTGVYPSSSPGGWLLLGRTEARLWDPARQPPALLTPGTPVRFVRA